MIFKMIRICFEINVGLTSSTHYRNNWALSLTHTHNECRFVLNKKKKISSAFIMMNETIDSQILICRPVWILFFEIIFVSINLKIQFIFLKNVQ